MSRNTFLCHAAAWYGVWFAAPMLVAASNQRDIQISPVLLGAGLLAVFLAVTLASNALASKAGNNTKKGIARLMLAIALVLAIQGNLLHPLSDFGSFDGSIVDFRKYGRLFWLEWYGFLTGLVVFSWLLYRARRLPAWLPWIPILSFTLLWVPALFSAGGRPEAGSFNDHGPSVFEFSRNRNLIHLLADGLQSDVVEQVLREEAELAGRYRGFTLFADHLGMYYGTAPALPVLLTGIPFDFDKGHSYEWITPFIEENSYQNELSDDGFSLDLVTIDPAYCITRARSCVSRPFSDWKSRGYERNTSEHTLYSLKLLADLSLYRLSPGFIKEKIYNEGDWMFADSEMDGTSPWPDPVIREWVENMRVVDGSPVYKFYHYIGTHKPPFWNGDCERQSGLERNRENYLGQAKCILSGIAMLLDTLEENGIYDQTAIIISGDHGHDIAPADLSGPPESVPLSEEMMGTARPALLVKDLTKRGPLEISEVPTSLLDVAALPRDLSNLDRAPFRNFRLNPGSEEFRERHFYHYSLEKIGRWSREPVPYDTYRVVGPANDEASWSLSDIKIDHHAPGHYPVVSHRTASQYMRGAKLNSALPDKELAWIVREQLAFLISVPKPVTIAGQLVLELHIPEWLGEQRFSLRVNETDSETGQSVYPSGKFWQEVRIDLPSAAVRPGNNFISLRFDKLIATPDAPDMQVAGLLKSINIQ